jgi:hypothetical protein
MKKEISIKRLLEIKKGLEDILTLEISARVSLKIALIVRQASAHLEVFDRERTKLIEKYGKLEEENKFKIPPENMAVLNKELTEMVEVEVEISYTEIEIEELENVPKWTTAYTIALLDFMNIK